MPFYARSDRYPQTHTGSKKMTICKRSGIEFKATSTRVKQHPLISEWLQLANREKWYSACVETIEALRESGASSIEEFEMELKSVRQETIQANEQKQAEAKEYWDEIKKQQKKRKVINSALRKAGYYWRKTSVDAFEIFSDEEKWTLFDSDDNPVSLEEALSRLKIIV